MIPAYALYRRSTTQQDLSIEQQREAVRAWAAEHGYEIVREFADDASGLDTARRLEFLALLQLCSQPHLRVADVVLVYDVSRFSRLDPEEAALHEYSLRRAGVTVRYTHEPGLEAEGVAGHLMKTLKRVLAHDYSHKLSQVVRRGLRKHAQLGLWTGGRPPFGYRRAIRRPDGSLVALEDGQRTAKGDSVVLAVDPIEARVVREDIFEPYASRGLGVRAIANALNTRCVPPPDSLRRGGAAAWSKTYVWHMLRNDVYVGRLVYGKARYRDVGKKRGKRRQPETERIVVENAVPAIVPLELWDAAQRVHGTRRFASGRPWHRPYLLSSLIVCAACGKRFQAQRQQRGAIPAYYLCGGYVASGAVFCASPRIPTTYLDDAVLDGIQKRLDRVVDLDELRRRVREALGPEDRPIDTDADLETRLRETRAKIGRLVEALALGRDELPSLRAALVQLEQERERLERTLADVHRRSRTARPTDSVADELVGALSNVRAVLEDGNAEERKAVVRSFVKEITIEAAQRRAVLRWCRLPQLSWVKLVAVGGIEPPTQGL